MFNWKIVAFYFCIRILIGRKSQKNAYTFFQYSNPLFSKTKGLISPSEYQSKVSYSPWINRQERRWFCFGEWNRDRPKIPERSISLHIPRFSHEFLSTFPLLFSTKEALDILLEKKYLISRIMKVVSHFRKGLMIGQTCQKVFVHKIRIFEGHESGKVQFILLFCRFGNRIFSESTNSNFCDNVALKIFLSEMGFYIIHWLFDRPIVSAPLWQTTSQWNCPSILFSTGCVTTTLKKQEKKYSASETIDSRVWMFT